MKWLYIARLVGSKSQETLYSQFVNLKSSTVAAKCTSSLKWVQKVSLTSKVSMTSFKISL